MKEHERAVLSSVMFQAGVIPIDDPALGMRRGLNTLPPEESRKLKRKFRKLWRKLAREEARNMGRKPDQTKTWLTSRYGAGKSNPSRADKLARKSAVQKHFYETYVRPALDMWEAGRTGDQVPTKP